MSLIPPSFLFRFCYPCMYVKEMPLKKSEDLLGLDKICTLPDTLRLKEKPGFAELRMGWNEKGMGFEVRVQGKDRPVRVEPGKYRTSDGLSLWIDTRSARESHRASRHCHHFYFLPGGSGDDGELPSAGQTKIHRALADAPLCSPDLLQVHKHHFMDGYRLECYIPREALNGYDPDLNRQFGFFYSVRDSELGEQTLSLGPEFPYAEDPSLWQLIELNSAS